MNLEESIWRYRRDPGNGLSDYLLLFPQSRQWVNLNVLSPDDKRYLPYGGWLADCGDGEVYVCLKNGKEWKRECYRNLGEMLQWQNCCGSAFDLDRVTRDSLSENLMSIVHKFISKLPSSDMPKLPNNALDPTAYTLRVSAAGQR